MQKYFKAKIPFSSGTGIYNPADKEPSKADAKLVDSWAEVGYCEIVEAIIEEPKQPENKEPQKEAQNEPNEPNEPVNDSAIQKVADEPKQPENGENEAKNDGFEGMTYPQLKKAAKKAGIKNYQSMKQADLINALKGE